MLSNQGVERAYSHTSSVHTQPAPAVETNLVCLCIHPVRRATTTAHRSFSTTIRAMVIRTERYANVRLYWRIDGSLVVRKYPSHLSRHNPLGWLIGKVVQVTSGCSALSARDSTGPVAVALAWLAAMLTWASRHYSHAVPVELAGVALVLWVAMMLAAVVQCDLIARTASWCQYWWDTEDWELGSEPGKLLAARMLADARLNSPDREKVLSWLLSSSPSRTTSYHEARGVSTGQMSWRQAWHAARAPLALDPTTAAVAIGLWEPDGADLLSDLNVALESAGHMLAAQVA